MENIKKILPFIVLAVLTFAVIALLIWISNGVLRQIDEGMINRGYAPGILAYLSINFKQHTKSLRS